MTRKSAKHLRMIYGNTEQLFWPYLKKKNVHLKIFVHHKGKCHKIIISLKIELENAWYSESILSVVLWYKSHYNVPFLMS